MSWELLITSVTAISTALMAIGTFGVIYQNYRDKREANRANIVVFIKSVNLVMYFVVKNIGLTAAYDVKLSTKKPLENTQNLIFDSLFDNTIPHFPSKHEINCGFDGTIRYFKKFTPVAPTYTINVEFRDIYNKIHKYPCIIDLNYSRDLLVFLGEESDQIVDGLHKIDRKLEIIHKDIKQ